ncbi:MAG: PIG-L family deacetylase [Candidatus Delongbacteria bacterium]|nr:PIG-L family deacetylase [Candidatus Delongbacteria bacterium]
MIGVFSKLVTHFKLFCILLIAILCFQVTNQNTCANDSILIVTPHPDDETLGVGGHIARFAKQGDQVYVVALTAGEGNVFDIYLKKKTITPSYDDLLKYGEKRIKELIQSLKTLGVTKDNLFILGFPDGGLDFLYLTHWENTFTSTITNKNHTFYNKSFVPNTPFTGENIYLQLQQIINLTKPTKIFLIDTLDIHDDHWPSYCFAIVAILDIISGNNNFYPEIYTFPIHFQKYPNPKGYKKNQKLMPTKEMNQYNPTYQEYSLNHDEILLKKEAIMNYESQFLLGENLLLSFIRKNELFSRPIKFNLEKFKQYELYDSSIDVSSHFRETSANITKMKISRNENDLTVTLTTNGKINNNYNYFLRLNVFFDNHFERYDISYHDKKSMNNIFQEKESIIFKISSQYTENAKYLFLGMDTNFYPKVRKVRSFIDRTNYFIFEL